MNKRAYLRSNEGIFTLSPKITIIGRESCDFIIQNITIDSQQAVIEYFEAEDCFILKDLNSTHGTYVNECRIQNASVRLADGDIIKFGFSNGKYEFRMENLTVGNVDVTTTYTQIPITQRQSWQPNTILPQPQLTSAQITTLPVINYTSQQPIPQWHSLPGQGSWSQLPRAPSSITKLGRPHSANGLHKRQITPTAPVASSSSTSTIRRGSVSGPIKPFLPEQRSQATEDVSFTELQDEIDRLRYIENQCQEKTRQIESLVQQNNDLLGTHDRSISGEVYDQMKELTDEVFRKCNEVDRLQRLVNRLSDNSNRHNTNKSNNESDIGSLRQELEQTRKDLQISHGLVTSLQIDLGHSDETVKKLNREIEQLNHDLTEKDVSISALMSKLSRLKDIQEQEQGGETDKQDREREIISLKHKLKAIETSSQEKEEQMRPLTKMVEELKLSEKTNNDCIRDLNKNLEESKALIGDLQRSECLLRVDAKESENKYEKFRSKILHVALSCPGFKAGKNALKDEEMVEIMKDLVKSKVEHDRRICEKQKLCDAETQKLQKLRDSIEHFRRKLKECADSLRSAERTSNRIQDIVKIMKSTKFGEELQPLMSVVFDNFNNEMEFLSVLESCISDAGPELASLTLSQCFKRIIERSIEAVEMRSETATQLAKLMESHEEEIKRLKREHEEKMTSRISDVLNQERSRSESDIQSAVAEVELTKDQELERLSKESENKLRGYEQSIEEMQEIERKKEIQCQKNQELLLEKSQIIDNLERQLLEITVSKSLLEETMCEQFETINQKWQSEINAYKEETTQHAVTINSLNNRLTKLDNENKDLLQELTKLRSDNTLRKEKRKVTEADHNNPVLVNEINNFNSTIANLERCVSALRHENVQLKSINQGHEDSMKGLNMDLAGAEARLSDLKGELSESQKNEVTRLQVERQNLNEELNELRMQMSKMTTIVDNLIQELESKNLENKVLSQQLSEERQNVLEKEGKIQDLESTLLFEKETWLRNINQIEQEGRVSMELAAQGSQCRGDRHVQVIDAQKIALMEIRQKMKTIEMTQLPNSIVPEITKQMLQLKKELAESRANLALRDGAPRGVASLADMIPKRSAVRNRAVNIGPSDNTIMSEEKRIIKMVQEEADAVNTVKKIKLEIDMAKAIQFDLSQNFEMSEHSYFHLISELLEGLGIDKMKGLHSFANLPYEAKEQLKVERVETCGMIIQKIKMMKEMIHRKDELLQSYEKDLVKLKQAEDLTTKTQAQMDHIVQETRTKGEEVDLLRETLNRTKDLLDHEKRVNTAIKQNKHYIPEKSISKLGPSSESPKYHCPPEDIMGKEKQVEKKKSEKLKRKDYEIKSLKSELYTKEKELSHAINRLYTLESNMGMKGEEPVA